MDSDEAGRIEVIGDEVRDRLVSMGIRPGKHLVIHAKQPFRGPITVSVGKNVTSLSHDHARQIEITIEDS
jgi:Fe2+ transport system protein FeoA